MLLLAQFTSPKKHFEKRHTHYFAIWKTVRKIANKAHNNNFKKCQSE